ncbi:TPA: GNAT family N-acetyltransferase [Legionella pneumophila]|nr:GNAT family N-acetyltransferase [Legionella pneumophila]
MFNVSIRKSTSLDAEAIASVHVHSWKKAYQQFIPEIVLNSLSIPERTQLWNELLNNGLTVLVLEIDNQIIGFASICTFRDGIEDNSKGEISAIYIHPNFWHQGFGKKLSLAALKTLKELGYTEALLWVLSDNHQARSFYEGMGFELLNDKSKLAEFYDGGALLKEVLYKKKL